MAIQLDVTANEVKITNADIVNKGEYNINTCEFTFSEEFNNLTKRAVFSNVLDIKYMVTIDNNTCTIPEEILGVVGNLVIGVYGYTNNGDKLVLRYSPEPAEIEIKNGSYVKGIEEAIPSAAATDLYKEVEDALIDLENKVESGYFNGEDGAPGYTPVKGQDYFTSAEINEFTTTITNNVNSNIGLLFDSINGEVI